MRRILFWIDSKNYYSEDEENFFFNLIFCWILIFYLFCKLGRNGKCNWNFVNAARVKLGLFFFEKRTKIEIWEFFFTYNISEWLSLREKKLSIYIIFPIGTK